MVKGNIIRTGKTTCRTYTLYDSGVVPSLYTQAETQRDGLGVAAVRPRMMNLSVADCMPTSPVSRGYERRKDDGGRDWVRRVRRQRQMHFESHNVAAVAR